MFIYKQLFNIKDSGFILAMCINEMHSVFYQYMTCIQFLLLWILTLNIVKGKYLLVNTEEKELHDDNKPLDHGRNDNSDSNRIMKQRKNDHKKKGIKPKVQKNLKSSGREHTVHLKGEDMEKLDRGLLNSICTVLIPIPVFCDTLVRK